MKSDLIKEASKRYPAGTKFLSLFDYRVFTSTDSFYEFEDKIYITLCNVGCVYSNGNWAAIVKFDPVN